MSIKKKIVQNPVTQRFVKAINEVKKIENLNQKNLSDKIQVSDTAIGDLLRGSANAGGKVIINFLMQFDYVSSEYIIRGKGELILDESKRLSTSKTWTTEDKDILIQLIEELNKLAESQSQVIGFLRQQYPGANI